MKLSKSKYGFYFINDDTQVVGYYIHGNIRTYCMEDIDFGYYVSSINKRFYI